MIKCVLFDLDGVLADATDWHYRAFNKSLLDNGLEPISYDEHIEHFNGLPTIKKIELLRIKGIKIGSILEEKIQADKQKNTVLCIKQYCSPLPEKIELIDKLKELGCKIGVCTNSIRNTLDLILEKSNLEGFDITLSNQDVDYPKPSPEIYLKAMRELGVLPEETLIIEDSPKGKKAAYDSGAHVLEVDNYYEVTLSKVLYELARISYQNLQILIPMAGRGSRFARVGYTLPKPLIPVLGKSMIKYVIDNLHVKSATWHFVCLKDHIEKFKIDKELIRYISDKDGKVSVIAQHGLKQGAACSASLAFKHLDKESPLMLANSDQFVDLNIYDFLASGLNCDGAMMTFKSQHPKWSYASVKDGFVSQVKEKVVISDNATSGIYLWNRAQDFIDGVNDMVKAGDMHNNEYYVAPSYNYCIKRGKKYRLFEIKRNAMWGLGTPEDLIRFVDHYEE